MNQNMRKKGSNYKGYIIKIEIKTFMTETTKLVNCIWTGSRRNVGSHVLELLSVAICN